MRRAPLLLVCMVWFDACTCARVPDLEFRCDTQDDCSPAETCRAGYCTKGSAGGSGGSTGGGSTGGGSTGGGSTGGGSTGGGSTGGGSTGGGSTGGGGDSTAGGPAGGGSMGGGAAGSGGGLPEPAYSFSPSEVSQLTNECGVVRVEVDGGLPGGVAGFVSVCQSPPHLDLKQLPGCGPALPLGVGNGCGTPSRVELDGGGFGVATATPGSYVIRSATANPAMPSVRVNVYAVTLTGPNRLTEGGCIENLIRARVLRDGGQPPASFMLDVPQLNGSTAGVYADSACMFAGAPLTVSTESDAVFYVRPMGGTANMAQVRVVSGNVVVAVADFNVCKPDGAMCAGTVCCTGACINGTCQ